MSSTRDDLSPLAPDLASHRLDPALGAVLPIVGVIVGAALAYLWNYFLRRRDEVSERRAVARLLIAELGENRLIIKREGPLPNRWTPGRTSGIGTVYCSR